MGKVTSITLWHTQLVHLASHCSCSHIHLHRTCEPGIAALPPQFVQHPGHHDLSRPHPANHLAAGQAGMPGQLSTGHPLPTLATPGRLLTRPHPASKHCMGTPRLLGHTWPIINTAIPGQQTLGTPFPLGHTWPTLSS